MPRGVCVMVYTERASRENSLKGIGMSLYAHSIDVRERGSINLNSAAEKSAVRFILSLTTKLVSDILIIRLSVI